jgi:methyl-accepting chemotaxis protein
MIIINYKLLKISLILLLPTLSVLVYIFVKRNTSKNDLIKDLENDTIDNSKNMIKNVHTFCTIHNEAMNSELDSAKNFALYLIEKNGGISISNEKFLCHIKNQFTKKVTEEHVNKMMLGNKWVKPISDPDAEIPIVTQFTKMTGFTCSLMQKINENGDLMRVVTNIKEGKYNAIYSYIPHKNPDGYVNKVIEKMIKGETFTGKYFVANGWNMSIYTPLYNKQNEIIGMFGCGIPETSLDVIRKTILNYKLYDSGYVFVVGGSSDLNYGSGDMKGRYIISKDGKRDGEYILDKKDASGNYFVRDIINSGIKTLNGQSIIKKYKWKNPGETFSRYKLAAITYFEPWDWIIGASVYENEYLEVLTSTKYILEQTLEKSIYIGVLSLLITGVIIRIFDPKLKISLPFMTSE